MYPDSIVLDSPLDMHLHLREGELLRQIAPCSTSHIAGAVIMPNLVDPVTDLQRVKAYREEIASALGGKPFTPLMTLFFRKYTYAELEAARDQVFAVKLYPEGVTTNSDAGVRDLNAYDSVFAAMAELGIPLLVHGETHGFVMDREREFLAVYETLAKEYPTLKIVMEHISTREAVAALDQHENVYATVTLHHLLLTLDDMAGGMLDPHLFCKPLLKRPEDREALQAAVLDGHPKLMFGSDSAPHPRHKKECCGCAAGVFSAPVALPLLAEFFDHHGKTERMQGFVSDHARNIHRLKTVRKMVKINRERFQIPTAYGPVVPYRAGCEIPWSVES